MRKSLSLTVFFLLVLLFLGAEERRPDMTVMVPMRDGKALATDIYLPSAQARNLPCLLVRSPSGRVALPALANLSFVEAGYMVAIQETRSAADKEGKTMPCIHDGWGEVQDGYDTVEWLAKSKLSNGKIGTVGPSILGISQLMLAPTAPAALKAQFIQFACGSIFHHAAYSQGQLLKHQIESWLFYYAKDPCIIAKIKSERIYNQFWASLDSNARAEKVKVPAIFVAGWFDTFLQGTIDAFQARQDRGGIGAKGTQKLVIGPWAHFWPMVKTIGDFPIPDEALKLPTALSPLRWFDHYLKGTSNGAEDISPVTYYVMGPFDGTPSRGNRWREAKTWPVPSVMTPFYLTAENGLVDKELECRDKAYRYLYDPNDPSPTIGGKNLFLESGAKDQREIESRSDVVSFTSPVLTEDLEVTGRIKAKLYVSTDSEDTDFIVRLTDVYPDGKSILITDSAASLSCQIQTRNASSKQNPIPHVIEVDLHTTSLVFAKGHKIRLSVSSSNYPRFEKNLNVAVNEKGEPLSPAKVATNTVWVGARTPSQLVLPVVK